MAFGFRRFAHACALLSAIGLLPASGLFPAAGLRAQSTIRILVNDDPITSYDVRERAQMVKVFSRGQQGESDAIEQLIDEQLMLQEAERRGVEMSDEEVEQEVANRARAAKLTSAQFQQAMRQAGFDPETFKRFVRANMGWQQIVRARFRATVDVTDQDVAAALTGRTEPAEGTTASEYRLQQILFIVPAGAGAGVEAQRQSEASAFRANFQSCDQSLAQAGGAPGIVVKPQMRREESQMNEAQKTALAGLDVGGITEPERVTDGIQLLAICGKTAIAGQTGETVEVREELSNERGQLLARRYLRDLRSDAVIEYR